MERITMSIINVSLEELNRVQNFGVFDVKNKDNKYVLYYKKLYGKTDIRTVYTGSIREVHCYINGMLIYEKMKRESLRFV